MSTTRERIISASAALFMQQGYSASGLKQISDAGAIEKIVDRVLASNAKRVEDYRAGKEKAFNSLVGQVMKETKGTADPRVVNERIREKLSA